MKRRHNKLMALLLSGCLMFSVIPSTVYADPGTDADIVYIDGEDAEAFDDLEITEEAPSTEEEAEADQPADSDSLVLEEDDLVKEGEEQLGDETDTTSETETTAAAESFWAALNAYAEVANDASYPFAATEDGSTLVSTNKGVKNGKAYITIKAKQNFALGFRYKVSSEASYDYMSVVLNGNDLHSSEKKKYSGTMEEFKLYTLQLAANDELKIGYAKDSSGDKNDDCIWLKDFQLIPIITFTGAPTEAVWLVVDNDKIEYPVSNGSCALPAGTYTYHAEAFGYPDADGTFTVGAEELSKEVAVTMPQNTAYKVSFALTGKEEGKEVEIRVLHGADAMTAGEDGSYSLTPAEYSYTISGTGYKTVSGNFTVVAADQSIPITLESVPTVEEYLAPVLAYAELDNSGSYPFTIPDSGDKLISSNKGKSNSESQLKLTFTKPAIVSFDYTVSSEANYDKIKVTLNGTSKQEDSGVSIGNVSVQAGAGDVLLITYAKDSSGDRNEDQATVSNFFVQALRTITFTGAPEGAEIVVKDAMDKVVTAANGTAVVGEGTYSYSISAFGYETKTGTVTITDADASIDASLTALSGKKLSFNITGLADGIVPAVTVTREGTSYEADENGKFDLIPSTYNYKVKAEGYKTVKGSVEITDADVELPITMVEGIQWDGQAAEAYDAGAGTAEDPYQIRTTQQLAFLSAQVAAGNKYEGTYFILTADLDMGGDEGFTPIGTTSSLCFKGNIDGNGHSIDNLLVEIPSNYAGLFGYVDGAVIRNLTVGGSISGKSYVGGITGYANGGAILENLTNTAAVTGTAANVGGIVGRANGSSTAKAAITGCINTGAISNGTNSHAGGIGGYIQHTNVSSCYNTGSVISNRGGGITGQDGIGSTFKNLYSIGDVTLAEEGSNNYAGSLVGYVLYSENWENCYYLSGAKAVGNGNAAAGMLEKTEAQLKSPAVIAGMGGSFIPDANNINNGFPVLGRQDPNAQFTVYFEVEGAVITVKNAAGEIVEAGEDANTYSLASGSYTYRVEKEECETVEGSFEINGSGLKLTPEMVVRTYDVIVNVSPADVPVIITDAAGEETTLTNGTTKLPKGAYSYAASKFGYDTVTGSFTVTGTADILAVTLAEAQRYPVTFTIKAAETDEALADAVISLSHAEGGQQTAGEDGAYALPNGEYSYTVTCQGYINVKGKITIKGAAQNIALSMEEGSNVWTGEKAETAPAVQTIDGKEFYLINTAEELAWAADQVNTVKNTGINLKLMTNLVLNSDEEPTAHAWPGIGSYDNRYAGILDGNGKTISGLYSKDTGLLGYCAADSLVKDLTVSGKIIEAATTGGFANQSYGSFENCTNRVDITADYNAAVVIGGIVGRGYGDCSVTGSANEGKIEVLKSGNYSDVKVGGIAGDMYGSVDQCSNSGEICSSARGSLYLGGIIGSSNGRANEGGARVTNCWNTGVIAATAGQGNYVGGISGRHTVGSKEIMRIANCYNAGQVSGTASAKKVGAIAGDTLCNIENCYYLTGTAEAATASTSEDITVEATAMEDEAMRQPALVLALGNSVWGASAGQYPIFLSKGGTAVDDSENAQAVAEAKAALTFTDTLVTENRTLELPTTVEGFDGTITWNSDNTNVITDAGAVTLPEDGVVYVKMTATLIKGTASDTKEFIVTVKSTKAVDKEILDAAASYLNGGSALTPSYGIDTNINTYAKGLLEQKAMEEGNEGWSEIEVSVSAQGTRTYPASPENLTAGIEADGTIDYMYIDPSELTFAVRSAAISGVEFTLSLRGQTAAATRTISLGWDAERLQPYLTAALNEAKHVFDAYKDENGNIVVPHDVESIEMPRTLENFRYVQLQWSSESENMEMASEDPTGSTTTMHLIQPEDDTNITLIGYANFTLDDWVQKIDENLVTFTLLGTDLDVLRQQMQEGLDAGYTADKLTYIVSGNKVDPEHVNGDIQLLTSRNTGIEGYSDYRFTVTSNKEDVIKVNGYRANVYRSMPDQQAEEVVLTVTMAHRKKNISVQKELTLKVEPLTTAELDEAVALMDAAKEIYWTALNDNANTDAEHVTTSLHAFQEIDRNADGELYAIYNYKDRTNKGIVVGDMADYSTVGGQEAYNKFRSSVPAVIAHENLVLHTPQYNTDVTIDSVLEHAVYAKYAKTVTEGSWYENYFSKLAGVPVSADLRVMGTDGEDPTKPREIQVTVRLTGVDMTGAIDKQITVMSSQTIAEALQAGFGEDYKMTVSSAGYVQSLTGPADFNEVNKAVAYWGQYIYVNGSYDCVSTLTEKVTDGGVYAIISNESTTDPDSFWGYKYDVWFGETSYAAEVGQSISPIVYQMAGNTATPWGGVKVYCGGKEIAVTDADGKAAISFNRPGEYLITTGDSNHIFSYAKVTVTGEEPEADYSKVDEALAKVPADLSIYTEESAQAVEAAVAAVDRTLRMDAQETVDAMAEAIESAVKGLELKPVVEEIKLDEESIELVTYNKAEDNTAVSTKQLKAIVLPENAENKNVIWRSDDESVATVDEKGLVTAHRYGKAVITARTEEGGYIATCNVQARFYDGVEGVKNGSNVITKNIADSINWMADEGITTGYDKINFGSFRTTSRADFIIFLWRYAGKPAADASKLKTFTDVEGKYTKTSATYQAITWGASEGIINGYSDGTFKPKASVTRGQVAIMLWKYAGMPEVTGTPKNFPDVKIDRKTGATANMVKAINWASSNKLVNGYNTGKFEPTGNCLRFQMSVIIYRFNNSITK
ncbi:MAG: S-layer homology domain-containing protein [Eubacteriales bacterium]|nr:S-layer homology domain-containing protein [Eubacteriales bacterium]